MRAFTDAAGRTWLATAHEEQTPRHHTRFFLVFHSDRADGEAFPMPEVRWQTLATADRTIGSMSVFELRKRLRTAVERRDASRGEPDPADARSP